MGEHRSGRFNRRKGHDDERAVARWLRGPGGFSDAERRLRTGYRGRPDTGDIDNVPGVVIQVKGWKNPRINRWLKETEDQMAAAGVDLGVLVHHTPGKSNPGDWAAWLILRRIGVYPDPKPFSEVVANLHRILDK